MTMATFREKLIARMDETGISVAELARRSGVTYDTITKLKQRKGASTKAESAQALARALGITEPPTGFDDPAGFTPARRTLESLDAPASASDDDLKIGTDGKFVQIVATVDRAGLDRLIRRLEAMKLVLNA